MKHTLIAIIFLSAASGCRREPSPASPLPADASPVPVARPQPVTQGAPRMNETRSPEPKQLGTLPPDIGIAVGQRAPDAVLRDANGQAVQLRDLVAKGPILLVFYRGGWCPFCNFQIHELTSAFPELERRGVTPVAVSVDRIEEAAKTKATYTILFPVLSDPELAAHRAFRIVHHADEAEVARLKGFGFDVERSSGRDHHDFAIPSVFVIDRDGLVRWAHADADYKVRPSTAQLLAAIDDLHLTNRAERE
ncbi:MAG: AhpC/TSA family protein [Deltaproteobacteria bacterium]|nr:AhpC/TSA family protein [Deltaproteobacteria bacterium]